MLSFIKYLIEAAHVSIFDPTQKYEHSTHASSLHILEGKKGADHFIRMTNEIVNSINNNNTVPDHVRTKFDGAPAIFASQKHIAKKGKKVASAHSEIRSVWDKSSQGLRNVMHSAMKHLRPLVPKNVTVMGDVMHMGGTTRRESGRKRVVDPARQVQQGSFRPNLLHYHHTTPEGRIRAEQSHIGFVPHTVIEGQNTRPITRQEYNSINEKGKERGVDVISPFIDHKVNFTDHEKEQIDHHRSNYIKAHNAHDYSKTEHHSDMFEQYINSGIWENKKHSVDGYRNFLQKKATTHKDKKVREQASRNLSSIDNDAPHLENSLKMFRHSRAISKIINDATSRNHPIKTTHEGQSMPHEGVVSSMPVQGMKGHGPVIKFVDRRSAAEGGFSGLNKAVGQMSKGPTITESTQSTTVLSVGKIRYATPGHAKMIRHAKKIADKLGADLHIHLTGTSEPLTPEQKIQHAQAMFGHPVESTKNVFDSLQRLTGKHHSLHIVAGSDRADEYRRLPSKYVDKSGKEIYNFPGGIHVHEVPGKRVSIADIGKHPSKMNRDELEKSSSATEVIGLAKKGDYEGFKAYHPGVSEKIVKSNYDTIRSQSMKEEKDPMILFRKFIDAKRLVPSRSGSKGGDGSSGGNGGGGNGGGNGNGN